MPSWGHLRTSRRGVLEQEKWGTIRGSWQPKTEPENLTAGEAKRKDSSGVIGTAENPARNDLGNSAEELYVSGLKSRGILASLACFGGSTALLGLRGGATQHLGPGRSFERVGDDRDWRFGS